MRSILSQHDSLIDGLVDTTRLDEYHRLTEQVSQEANAILCEIHAIKDSLMHDAIASNKQACRLN
jgi:hypothetical protein